MYGDKVPAEITSPAEVTQEVLDAAMEWAEANYGLGNNFTIDWERVWHDMEVFAGFDLQSWGAEEKIKQWVNRHKEW